MTVSSFDPTDPRIELELTRERLKNSEERNRQLEENVKQAFFDLGRKDTELQRIRDERDDVKIKWEVAKIEIGHKQELLMLTGQKKRENRSRSIRYNIFGNLLICFAGVLVAFGTSILAAPPPNQLGWLIIVSAIVVYFVGAVFIATRGGEE